MQIVEIGSDKNLQKEFITLPIRLYTSNKLWIRPLDKDVEGVFDPTKNKFFKGGECTRWLAINEQGETVGRIAAFINQQTASKGNDQPTGGTGFFECIDNQNTANQLFDTCRTWLLERGMEAMDGPINFGERDRFWGLLVEGYDKEPLYGMGYHHPYYKNLFENYGFQDYFQQYTYWTPLPEAQVRSRINDSFFQRAQRIYATPGYDFIHIKKNRLPKFAEDFRVIYNQAWAGHLGVGDMTSEKANALMNQMKPILDEELVWFGYYEGVPIAFFIMLPELNQLFKYVNGKLDLIGKIKVGYHQLMKTNKRAFGVIFGVVPEYQRKGVESAIALSFSKVAWHKECQYTDLEFNWIGDFNKKMIRFVQLLGAEPVKTHITYRFLFDRTKEFKRHPII